MLYQVIFSNGDTKIKYLKNLCRCRAWSDVSNTLLISTSKYALYTPSAYLSVAGGEGSQVSHYARWDKDVPSQVIVELSEIEGHFAPACLLSTQASNKLLSPLQLLTAQIHLEDTIGWGEQKCVALWLFSQVKEQNEGHASQTKFV